MNHNNKIWLVFPMAWSVALLGCNPRNSYLGIMHAEEESTASSEVSISSSLSTSIVSMQVETEEIQDEFIANKNRLIEEKEQEITATNAEKRNKQLSEDALTQQNEENRNSVVQKNKDTQDTYGEIYKNTSSSCDFTVTCCNCNKRLDHTQDTLKAVLKKYDMRYLADVEKEYKWSIFSGSSYSCTISNRRFRKCFACLNQEDIQQLEKEIRDNETRLGDIQKSIARDDHRLVVLNDDKESLVSDREAYRRQVHRVEIEREARVQAENEREEAQNQIEEANRNAFEIEERRRSEKEARIQAERECEKKDKKIAELEAQLAVMGAKKTYTEGQLLHEILGDSEEARVAVKRSNDPKVYRCVVKKEENSRAEREKSDTKMPSINESQENIERIEESVQGTTRAVRRIGNKEDSSESQPKRTSRVDQHLEEVARTLIRSSFPTEVICLATGYTPEQVEALRIAELPQEIVTPREQEDDMTTLTSHGDIRTQFTIPPSMEPEELSEVENLAFGSQIDEFSGEEVENEDQASSAFTILPSIASSEL